MDIGSSYALSWDWRCWNFKLFARYGCQRYIIIVMPARILWTTLKHSFNIICDYLLDLDWFIFYRWPWLLDCEPRNSHVLFKLELCSEYLMFIALLYILRSVKVFLSEFSRFFLSVTRAKRKKVMMIFDAGLVKFIW